MKANSEQFLHFVEEHCKTHTYDSQPLDGMVKRIRQFGTQVSNPLQSTHTEYVSYLEKFTNDKHPTLSYLPWQEHYFFFKQYHQLVSTLINNGEIKTEEDTKYNKIIKTVFFKNLPRFAQVAFYWQASETLIALKSPLAATHYAAQTREEINKALKKTNLPEELRQAYQSLELAVMYRLMQCEAKQFAYHLMHSNLDTQEQWIVSLKIACDRLAAIQDWESISSLYTKKIDREQKSYVEQFQFALIGQIHRDWEEEKRESQAYQTALELIEQLTQHHQFQLAINLVQELSKKANCSQIGAQYDSSLDGMLTQLKNFQENKELPPEVPTFTPITASLRDEVNNALQNAKDVENPSANYSDELFKILKTLATDLNQRLCELLGATSPSFALIIDGSIPTRTATCDSDLDPILLFDGDPKVVIPYVAHFVSFLNFALASAGNGNRHTLQLDGDYTTRLPEIGADEPTLLCTTPAELALWVAKKHKDLKTTDWLIAHGLLRPEILYASEGGESLLEDYHQKLNEKLNQKEVATTYLIEHCRTFSQDFPEELNAKTIKDYLLAPLNFLIIDMALFFLPLPLEHDITKLLDQLTKQFAQVYIEELKNILERLSTLRFKLTYSQEKISSNMFSNAIKSIYQQVNNWIKQGKLENELKTLKNWDPILIQFYNKILQWNIDSTNPNEEDKKTLREFLTICLDRYKRHESNSQQGWNKEKLLSVLSEYYRKLTGEPFRQLWIEELEALLLPDIAQSLCQIPNANGFRQQERIDYDTLYQEFNLITEPLPANKPAEQDLWVTLTLPTFHNQTTLTTRIVKNDVLKQIVDAKGKFIPAQNTGKSRHTVAAFTITLEERTISWHIKQKPDQPIKDHFIHTLRRRFIGHGSPANIVGKLEIHQGEKSIASYPVLISPTVGDNLGKIVEKEPDKDLKLNVPLLQQLALLEYTIKPGDGRLANIQLVGNMLNIIDNDQYAVIPVVREYLLKTLQMVSAVFCASELKNVALDQSSLEMLASIHIEPMLYYVLRDTQHYEKAVNAIFTPKEIKDYFKDDKKNPRFLKLLLPRGYLIDISLAWIDIQQRAINALENAQSPFFPWDFFTSWDKEVSHYYAPCVNTQNQTLVQSFAKLNCVSQSMSSEQNVTRTFGQQLTEKDLAANSEYTIEQLFKELSVLKIESWRQGEITLHQTDAQKNNASEPLHHLQINLQPKDTNTPLLTPKRQRFVLDMLAQRRYARINFKHCPELSENWYKTFATANASTLVSLHLEHVPLSTASLQKIASLCSALTSLSIKHISNPNFTVIDNAATFSRDKIVFAALQEIKLSHVPKITTISARTAKLKKLTLRHLPLLKTAKFFAPELKHLIAEDNPELENLLLEDQNNEEPDFESVSIKGCQNIKRYNNPAQYPTKTTALKGTTKRISLVGKKESGIASLEQRLSHDKFEPNQNLQRSSHFVINLKHVKCSFIEYDDHQIEMDVNDDEIRGAGTIILTFNVSDTDFLEDLEKYISALNNKLDYKDIIILALQCDRSTKLLLEKIGKNIMPLAKKIGAKAYIECSARTGRNIQGLLQEIEKSYKMRAIYQQHCQIPKPLKYISYTSPGLELSSTYFDELYIPPHPNAEKRSNSNYPDKLDDEQEEEFVFKIISVGDIGSGNTSLVQSITYGGYVKSERPTIGVDYRQKMIIWSKNKSLRLLFWDIGSQERYYAGALSEKYCKEACLAIIGFNPVKAATLEGAKKWHAWALQSGINVPTILVATKCDLVTKEQLRETYPQAMAVAKEIGAVRYIVTSAKENIGCDELVNEAALLAYTYYGYDFTNLLDEPPWKHEASNLQEESERKYKGIVIGPTNIGKSAIALRAALGKFNPYTAKPTSGVDFFCYTALLNQGKQIILHLLDISGYERLREFSSMYYKGSTFAITAFSALKFIDSFEPTRRWGEHLNKNISVPKILIATQCDPVTREELDEIYPKAMTLAKEIGALFYIETSASKNVNIERLMEEAAKLAYKYRDYDHTNTTDDPPWKNEEVQYISYQERLNEKEQKKLSSDKRWEINDIYTTFKTNFQNFSPLTTSENFKIVMLGGGESKTGLCLQLETKSRFKYATIQASFTTFRIRVKNHQVNLAIWDTAGQERFHALGPIYYRDASLAIIAFDPTDLDTLERAKNWGKELRKMLGNDFPKILIATYYEEITSAEQHSNIFQQAVEIARTIGFLSYIEVSAKTFINLDILVLEAAILAHIYRNENIGLMHSDPRQSHSSRTKINKPPIQPTNVLRYISYKGGLKKENNLLKQLTNFFADPRRNDNQSTLTGARDRKMTL